MTFVSASKQFSAEKSWNGVAALIAAATGYAAFSYGSIPWKDNNTSSSNMYQAESLQKHLITNAHHSTSYQATSSNPTSEPNPSWQAGKDRPSDLATYSREEVMKHCSEDDYWITYFNGVYDVTKFLDEHPGNRSRLLLASHGNHDVGSFWKQLGQHNQPLVHKILERYRIGNVRTEDVVYSDVLSPPVDPKLSEERRDLYDHAFSYEPFIAETPIEILASDQRYTPVNYHFVRNHFGVPMHLSIDDRIHIKGIGVKKNQKKKKETEDEEDGLWISYRDLYRLPYVEREVLMQCGGHRRREFDKYGETKGSKWDVGAIGNTKFRGVLLRDLFKKLDIDVHTLYDSEKEYHVWFIGADTDPSGEHYGVSIPLAKALDPRGDVMIAYQQNGAPLTHDHGWPARVLVPGWVGARSVKWIQEIIISEKECNLETFTKSYRMTSDNKAEIRDVPVNSAIFMPQDGSTLHLAEIKKKGGVTIKGEAHSGGGRKIIRVDVSVDGGATWHAATLKQIGDNLEPNSTPKYGRMYTWTRWEVLIPLPVDYLATHNKQLHVICRAFDESHNRQPETCQNDIVFNSKGYCVNSYHNITVNVV